MQIGDYDVQLLNTGLFRLDGGAMFGVVPKALWGKQKPPDEHNRIHMCTNALLLRGNGKTILVDTGIGEHNPAKFCQIYAVDTAVHNLPQCLANHGVAPADVTDVILTHLHFDHAGGATIPNENGTFRPAFPNAAYHVQQRHYEWSVEASEKDRASFLEENIVPLVQTEQLNLLNSGGEIFPGIELLLSDGHTMAQQMLLIHSDEQTLFFPADLIPTSAHVPVPWVMAYDLFPLITIEEKKQYLNRAASENWLVVFEHDPLLPCATVTRMARGYSIGDAVSL